VRRPRPSQPRKRALDAPEDFDDGFDGFEDWMLCQPGEGGV
jgi:hypothetical protein